VSSPSRSALKADFEAWPTIALAGRVFRIQPVVEDAGRHERIPLQIGGLRSIILGHCM